MRRPTARPTLNELLARREQIRDAEALFRVRARRDLDTAHADLDFYHLLTPSERRRLGHLLSAEAGLDPGDDGPPSCARGCWNELARTYLLRVLRLLDRAADGRAELSARVDQYWPHGIHLLTAYGSRVELGQYRLATGRTYRYQPLLGLERQECSRVRLTRPVEVGRTLTLGRLRISRVILVVRDTAPRSGSHAGSSCRVATLLRPARRSSLDAKAALGRYLARLDLLEEDDGAGFHDDLQECEALGEALFLQWLHDPDLRGLPLESVAEMVTTSGTRYRVEPPQGRGETTALHRIPPDGPCERFNDVDIGSQRVVPGAPLVVFARDVPGAVPRATCLTSPIALVLPR